MNNKFVSTKNAIDCCFTCRYILQKLLFKNFQREGRLLSIISLRYLDSNSSPIFELSDLIHVCVWLECSSKKYRPHTFVSSLWPDFQVMQRVQKFLTACIWSACTFCFKNLSKLPANCMCPSNCAWFKRFKIGVAPVFEAMVPLPRSITSSLLALCHRRPPVMEMIIK